MMYINISFKELLYKNKILININLTYYLNNIMFILNRAISKTASERLATKVKCEL